MCVVFPLAAQPPVSAERDTLPSYDIPEVMVTSHADHQVRSAAPLQVATSDNLSRMNAMQAADAIKHFSGVAVKDFGGVGGLKTVSVRSLGANHTAVIYDGVAVSDVQTGQIDIGRFSLDDVETISLVSGQSDDIFQPARSFASASVLNIQSCTPSFAPGERVNGRASLRTGSFSLVNPSFTLNGSLAPRLSATLGGEYLYTKGDYPFEYTYGNNIDDEVVTLRRENTDVQNLRIEGTVRADLPDESTLSAKAYYFHSQRGLPGSVTYYNPQQNTNQRTWDNTFFAQAHYRRDFSNRWALQANAKYHNSNMRYLDTGYLGSTGMQDNHYAQQEYYLSATALCRLMSGFSLSVATDGAVNTMQSDLVGFSQPTRYSLLTAVAIKYTNTWLQACASLLNTLVDEQVEQGDAAEQHCRFSPYAALSIKPFGRYDLRLRVSYKEIFRLPTFNDLYYTNVGNVQLDPEETRQYNIGLTYAAQWGRFVPHLRLTLDAYHNDVDNKIVALPSKKDIFLWSMVNYGKVSTTGFDLAGEVSLHVATEVDLSVGASYTYQRALNVTDPDDPYTYGHQIPYTPRVSGSARAGVETRWVDVAYSLIWSGHRYTFTQNYPANRLEGYFDHGISASREFRLPAITIAATVEVLNLGDNNYQVVRGFPMPGRSWRAKATVRF